MCGFAGSWRAEQDHVLAGVEKVELPEVLDHGLLHVALEGEIELLQRLAGREPGRLDPSLATVALPRVDLSAKEDLGEPLIGPGLLAGAVREHRQRSGGGRGFQGAEQVRELSGRGHRGHQLACSACSACSSSLVASRRASTGSRSV